MSRKITVQFNIIRSFAGVDADGEGLRWAPERDKEYQVTVEPTGGDSITLVLQNGIRMEFLPPGESSNYFVVREGWGEASSPTNRKATVKFNYDRNWQGKFADGSDGRFKAELDKEYAVTIEIVDNIYVNLIMLDGLTIQFYHPGHSTSYSVVREGWPTEAFSAVKSQTAKPILESTVILEIEPAKHNSLATNTEYLIYNLPRVLNGLLVDRGRCDQETVADRANTEAVGELRGIASFMLTSRNNHLRYRCISFRIDNKTTKKNLTLQYGSGSICTS